MIPAGTPLQIGDLIDVPPVKTVIRLEEGKENPAEIAGSFVFTGEVSSHLRVIAEALARGRGQGYFLQGDFGSGKSHLLAALYAWLSKAEGAARFSEGHPELKQAEDKKLLPVAVSLIDYRAATPLERILLECVEKALLGSGRSVSLTPLSAFLEQLSALLADPDAARIFAELADQTLGEREAAAEAAAPPEISEWIARHPRDAYAAGVRLLKKLGMETPQLLVEERTESFRRVFRELEGAGFDGIFLLIDELSEFFRSKPSSQALNEDARTLQFLGELAGERPLWIMAAVQESIERTGDIAQPILRKIRDRFPVKLALSTVHIRSLISDRLVQKKPGAEDEILEVHEHYRRQFLSFSSSFDEFLICYPVHPATISLLDGLGDLFSQHRGIVDFVYSRIAGDSRRGIRTILDRPKRELLGPDSIYDHFAGRLAEFSAFNVYPRHIVPHLDEEINRAFENGEDRRLARRLIRMLVLYHIHPTAELPNASKLAELVACSLDLPELNAGFIAEGLLDPLADASRFLRKKLPAGTSPGNSSQAVYEISTEEDAGKILDARIRRIGEEIPAADSRLLLEPLLQLPASDSWPGSAAAREGTVREIAWNLSTRRAMVRVLHRDDLHSAPSTAELEAKDCDFALFLTVGGLETIELAELTEPVGLWCIPPPEQGETLDTLREYLAAGQLKGELSPSNPADAPLIHLVNERLLRLKPAAFQAALEVFYTGAFSNPDIRVDAAVRQLRRFDSLLEAAGRTILAARYPRFAEVAPRRYQPSIRIYQQLLDSFVIPGSLSLTAARPLSAAIDGLAVPLGLVELKRGSYLFSPDITGHPLLVVFFELVRPAGSIPLPGVLEKLRRGEFGLPKNTALFLVAALAAGGLISIRKGNRAVALDYLNIQNLERYEEISLGELIGKHDRATLIDECGFLFSTDEPGSFGLRQQREAWKAVIEFRRTAENVASDTSARLAKRREYSSFKGFRFTDLQEKLEELSKLAGEIRVSYAAKEGLEKFLSAWRAGGIDGPAVELLMSLNRFLKQEAEKFVFAHHYVHHEAVEKASRMASGLERLRLHIIEGLSNPEELVLPDEGKELDRLFESLRQEYLPFYSGLHDKYYGDLRPPDLSKNAARALLVLRRLAGIEALDRPPGLDRFLNLLDSSSSSQCRRSVREELMRSPVCGCGFLPGQAVPAGAAESTEEKIDRFIDEYLSILETPGVREAVGSHTYAIEDLKPQAAAHLRELALKLEGGGLRASGLIGALDESICVELARAMSGKISLRKVSLPKLVNLLAGRRLPADKIISLVSEWLGRGRDGELIAVTDVGETISGEGEPKTGEGGRDDAGDESNMPGYTDWWAMQATGAFPGILQDVASEGFPLDLANSRRAHDLESQLEMRFPSSRLAQALRRFDSPILYRYILTEPLHTLSIQKAWQILIDRMLRGDPAVPSQAAGAANRASHIDPDRAAEIDRHLVFTNRIGRLQPTAFPQRLSLRPVFEALFSDPWAGVELQAGITRAMEELESLGETWLDGLPPVETIDLDRALVVLVIDGVSPDIWLEVMDIIESLGDLFSSSWARLDTEADTVSAMAGLFGLKGDPAESFGARDIPYINLTGMEEHALANSLESTQSKCATVIRLNVLDRGAHRGVYKLVEMAAVMKSLLERELPAVHRFCKNRKKDLILTTDHGLSLNAEGLSHGKGGIYERAVFRASWRL